MIDGLDGTEELADIDLDVDGSVNPEKNDKIALIDADTIAYAACISLEVGGDVLGEDYHTEEELLSIINDKQYDASEGLLYSIDLDQALAHSIDKINRILNKTGCQECELHFTEGRTNFRYDVYKDYKSNRTGRTPAGLSKLKEMLMAEYLGYMHTDYEADDAVVFYKKKFPEKYILVALDKDVYNSVPGTHFNYYESMQYNIDMKWVTTTESFAKFWPFIQTIIGDSGDGVPGCKGIGYTVKTGKGRALKFIQEDMTEEEMWNGTVRAWESKGMSAIDALITMNLVNMHLLQEGEEGKLFIKKWVPNYE